MVDALRRDPKGFAVLYDQAKALNEVFGSMKLIESVRPVLAGPQVFKLPDDPREAILVRYGIQRERDRKRQFD